MARSLGLALYLLFAGRGGLRPRQALPAPLPPRPEGPVIWMNLADPAGLGAARLLARALRRARRDLTLLVTLPPGAAEAEGRAAPGLLLAPAPADRGPAARAFLAQWRPDVAVFTEGEMPPALVCAAHARGIPLFLVNGRVPLLPGNPWRRAPGLMRALVGRFARILMQDATGLRFVRRLGYPAERVEAAGWLDEGAEPLSCTPAERDAMARAIGTRPVWLAVAVPPEEEAAVLAAHRAARRFMHRLLLILVPADPLRGPALQAEAEAAEGEPVALRSREEEPAEEDPVYIADTEGELGLWYRLASVCYLGGTLAGPGPLRDPFEPALLGAAVLCGPRWGAGRTALGRLAAAQGLRCLAGAAELGEAVVDLMAPDRAAVMAQAAWEVVTRGAETTERVTRLLLEALPAREGG